MDDPLSIFAAEQADTRSSNASTSSDSGQKSPHRSSSSISNILAEASSLLGDASKGSSSLFSSMMGSGKKKKPAAGDEYDDVSHAPNPNSLGAVPYRQSVDQRMKVDLGKNDKKKNVTAASASTTTTSSANTSSDLSQSANGASIPEGNGLTSSDGSGEDGEGDTSDEELYKMLTQEQKLMGLPDTFVLIEPGKMLPCEIIMTNYRFILIPSAHDLAYYAESRPSIHAWLQIPLGCVDRLERGRKTHDSQSVSLNIRLQCKDLREYQITIRLRLDNEGKLDNILNVMATYAFPNDIRYMFNFSYAPWKVHGDKIEKLPAYDALTEYNRQGVLDKFDDGEHIFIRSGGLTRSYACPWRISNANANFDLCSTYPRLMIAPAGLSDDELNSVAAFRSGKRLPTLSWFHAANGCTLWRSSQPKAGVSGSCSQDEKFLDYISKGCKMPNVKKSSDGVRLADPVLQIVDCRPRTSAMANRATGAGYESSTNYPNSRLEFYNIGNIHVMRDSLKSLCSVVSASGSASGSADINFSSKIEETQWLSHVRYVLKASYDSAMFIRSGSPVLVHCSHGWDRTAQVCSLSQLFLDPYYRTMAGFKILVEKEWCSFGHPFFMRCAHGQDRNARADDQMSPIFLQFLDCVWQLLRQYPHYFEFNSRYVLTLADHIYSGRFSTFLFNCDKDRSDNNATALMDVWTYLHHNKELYINPLYIPISKGSNDTSVFFFPPLSQMLRNVTLWTDYYFRWNSIPAQLTPPSAYLDYITQDGL